MGDTIADMTVLRRGLGQTPHVDDEPGHRASPTSPNRANQASRFAIVNGSVATFLGSDRFTVDRLKARVIFTSNQVEIEEATGYLGGGKFHASGGGILDGLAIQAFRVSLDGDNVTVPLPKDFITTGDAQLEFTGRRERPSDALQMTIGGP